MKLIYMIKRPLTVRDIERFGIRHFVHRGHEIEVWDLSEIIHPQLDNRRSDTPLDRDLTYRTFKSWRDVNLHAAWLKAADLVVFLVHSYKVSRASFRALRLISRLNVPYLLLAPALYPVLHDSPAPVPLMDRIKALKRRFSEVEVLNSILARIPRRWLGIAPARFVVFNGLASCTGNDLIGSTTRPIHAHTHDLEMIRAHAREGQERQLAVFLDVFMPHHPDLLVERGRVVPKADDYYAVMRRFFDSFEAATDLSVVIAAHPRADYTAADPRFGGRSVRFGETARLIAGSQLVIAHHSTAIGMAVALRKPILLTATTEILWALWRERPAFNGFASALGIPLHVLDGPGPLDLKVPLKIEAEKYIRYERQYLKHPFAEDRPLWEIVEDAITAEKVREPESIRPVSAVRAAGA